MKKIITDDGLIKEIDLGRKGEFLVMAAGAIAAWIVKDSAERAVKGFLIIRKLKLD